jgi:hypothetical protein
MRRASLISAATWHLGVVLTWWTGPAAAHPVPIPPSTCLLTTVELTLPGASDPIAVDPAGGQFTFDYEPEDGIAFLDFTEVPVLAFDDGGDVGSLALGGGSPIVATLDDLGHATIADLPATLTRGEVQTPLHLTLGTGAVVLGPGLDPLVTPGERLTTGTGRIGLAGGAAVAGDELVLLRLACSVDPLPDLDQYPFRVLVERLRARLAADGTKGLKVTAKLYLAPRRSIDLAADPLVLQLRTDADDTLTTVVPAGSLVPVRGGKRWIWQDAPDGYAAVVKPKQIPAGGGTLLTIKLRRAGMIAPGGPFGKVPVTLTGLFDIGDDDGEFLADFRPRKRGRLLVFP